MTVYRAFKWSFLAELAGKAVAPVLFVVLARLLTPEDYGVVAAATMVVSFSQVFWEAGMSKALIQYRGDVDRGASTAFWTNVALAAIVCGGLVFAADSIARLIFHDERVAPVLQMMTLQIALGGVTSVQVALLQRDLQFKRLFWVRLSTVIVPGAVSIPFAVGGLGYWALVIGTVAGAALQPVLLWSATNWRPAFIFDRTIASALMNFGVWVAVTGMLSWFYLWVDALFVGYYLGSHELGLYRTGNAVTIMIFGVIFAPVLPVLYSHLAEHQSNLQHVRIVMARVIRIVACISIPVGFMLYAMAEPISQILLGHEWSGIQEVISLLAILHGFTWIVGANGEAYRAIGRPDYETKVMGGSLVIYIVGYWLGVQYGLQAFLVARLGVALVGIALHLIAIEMALGLRAKDTIAHAGRMALVGIPIVAATELVNPMAGSLVAQFIAFLLMLVWVVGYIWLTERKAVIPEVMELCGGARWGSRTRVQS
jgi:O-antigen/teichoic acid export membrane protein